MSNQIIVLTQEVSNSTVAMRWATGSIGMLLGSLASGITGKLILADVPENKRSREIFLFMFRFLTVLNIIPLGISSLYTVRHLLGF